MKPHNFCAGPGILAEDVLKKSSEAIHNFENTGLSILEISHRSDLFIHIKEETTKMILDMMNLTNKGYQVLFLQGGASMEFLRIPYNLLRKKAAYLDTGTWAHNAILEAQNFGNVDIVASSRTNEYLFIPKYYEIPKDADYFHCTSNNTIYGTQMKSFPQTHIPIICDMSSDIFSTSRDYSQFGLIYAGAQKNLGAVGVSVIVVKESLLENSPRKIPNILSYKKHIEKESMYNTPNTFAIYTIYLTLKWMQSKGGIPFFEKQNKEKAQILYNAIDHSPFLENRVYEEDRSIMNIPFFLKKESMKNRFENLCKQHNIIAIQGHRTIGGYRASIYNAMPLESVKTLAEVIKNL